MSRRLWSQKLSVFEVQLGRADFVFIFNFILTHKISAVVDIPGVSLNVNLRFNQGYTD